MLVYSNVCLLCNMYVHIDQSGLSEEFYSGEFSVMVGEKTYKASLKKGRLS